MKVTGGYEDDCRIWRGLVDMKLKMTMMPTATVIDQDNSIDPSTQLRLILIMKRIFIRIQIYLSEDTKNKTTICFYLSEREILKAFWKSFVISLYLHAVVFCCAVVGNMVVSWVVCWLTPALLVLGKTVVSWVVCWPPPLDWVLVDTVVSWVVCWPPPPPPPAFWPPPPPPAFWPPPPPPCLLVVVVGLFMDSVVTDGAEVEAAEIKTRHHWQRDPKYCLSNRYLFYYIQLFSEVLKLKQRIMSDLFDRHSLML